MQSLTQALTPLRATAALMWALGAGLSPGAAAVMAGVLPDTPAARVDANTPASKWTSAVAVLVNGAVFSGVVVAPRYVLSAAHVVGGAAPSAVSVQINATATPVLHAALAIETFPGAAFPYDDLALIELVEPVPAAVHILPIYRQRLLPGAVLTLVGYGASGHGDSGATVAAAAGVKRAGGNVLDAIRTTVGGAGRTSLFYVFDFDGPSGNGPLGGPSLGNGIETGLAGGDSGSPVYAMLEGRTWLVGISNFVWPGTASVMYAFGTGGGGLLLSEPRVIEWLLEKTHGTLAAAGAGAGDNPSRRRKTPRAAGTSR